MATTIKTKVLLPRASLTDWQSSSRILQAGELVLAYDGTGKFRLFEGDGKTFAEGTKELKLDASQVVLSGDAEITLQQAIEDIKTAIGNALSGVEGTGTGVVTGLAEESNKVVASFTNLSGTQVADGTSFNVITSITQDAMGKITSVAGISALTEHQSLADYYTKSETSSAQEIADGLTAAIATANDYIDAVSAALSTDYTSKIDTAKSEAIEAANQYTDALSTAIDTKLEDFALSTDVDAIVAEVSVATLTAANGYTDGKIEDLSGTLTAYVEKSALSIGYDSTVKKIYLSGGTNVSEIDASDFIKDGMVSAVTYDHETRQIILAFNADGDSTPISVDVGDLVDTYTVASTSTIGLTMANNEISASVKENAITPYHLSADAGWVFDCNE